jgi:hypothetical protein
MWKTISYLFHPVLMPTLGILIVMVFDPFVYQSLDGPLPWFILLTSIFICTGLLPIFFSWILLKMERVSSLTNPTPNDRKQLIAFTELCFILGYYAVHNVPMVGRSLSCFMMGINIAMIVTLIASMFTKVSLHAVGIGGVLGTAIGLMYYTRIPIYPVIAGAIVLVSVIDYARYKLQAHTAFDIYLGNIIGITCTALVFIAYAR